MKNGKIQSLGTKMKTPEGAPWEMKFSVREFENLQKFFPGTWVKVSDVDGKENNKK